MELETALLRFMLEQQDGADAAPPKRPEALTPAKAPSAPPQKAKPKSPGDLSRQHVRAALQSIRSKAEGQRQSLRAPLSRAVVEAVDANAITLGLPEPWIADALKEHAKLIERAIEDVLGVALAVKVRVDGSVRATAAAPESEDPDELFDYASEVIRER